MAPEIGTWRRKGQRSVCVQVWYGSVRCVRDRVKKQKCSVTARSDPWNGTGKVCRKD